MGRSCIVHRTTPTPHEGSNRRSVLFCRKVQRGENTPLIRDIDDYAKRLNNKVIVLPEQLEILSPAPLSARAPEFIIACVNAALSSLENYQSQGQSNLSPSPYLALI